MKTILALLAVASTLVALTAAAKQPEPTESNCQSSMTCGGNPYRCVTCTTCCYGASCNTNCY